MRIALPEDNTILKFESQIYNLFLKMLANQTQIRTLEKLRDTLLPKLMSGEARVEF
jgi:type I restriction enzyme S subunit